MCLLNRHQKLPPVSQFNLGTGTGTSLKQLAKLIEIVFGKKTNINWGGKPYRKSDVMHAVADININKELLDWAPVITLEEGIRLMK